MCEQDKCSVVGMSTLFHGIPGVSETTQPQILKRISRPAFGG